MIDPKHPTIQALVAGGFKVAAHAYLRAGGRVNYSYVATHGRTGRIVQGWSAGGGPDAALDDLRRRAGVEPQMTA